MTSDQKRALTIGGVGIGGFLVWTHHRRSSGGGSSNPAPTLTSGASGSIAPYTPQSPITLAPGESIYDPNSEALLNTPTSPITTTDGMTLGPMGEQVLAQAPNVGPQANAPGAPSYVVNVNYPKQVRRHVHRVKPAKRTVKKKVKR